MFGCGCRSGKLFLVWLFICLILFYIIWFYSGRGVVCDDVEVLCGLDALLKLEDKYVWSAWGLFELCTHIIVVRIGCSMVAIVILTCIEMQLVGRLRLIEAP